MRACTQKNVLNEYVATMDLHLCRNHAKVECAHQASPALGAASAAGSLTYSVNATLQCALHKTCKQKWCTNLPDHMDPQWYTLQ